jgi:hypothetical protein
MLTILLTGCAAKYPPKIDSAELILYPDINSLISERTGLKYEARFRSYNYYELLEPYYYATDYCVSKKGRLKQTSKHFKFKIGNDKTQNPDAYIELGAALGNFKCVTAEKELWKINIGVQPNSRNYGLVIVNTIIYNNSQNSEFNLGKNTQAKYCSSNSAYNAYTACYQDIAVRIPPLNRKVFNHIESYIYKDLKYNDVKSFDGLFMNRVFCEMGMNHYKYNKYLELHSINNYCDYHMGTDFTDKAKNPDFKDGRLKL